MCFLFLSKSTGTKWLFCVAHILLEFIGGGGSGGSEGTSIHVSSSCFYLCAFFTFQYFLIHNKHPFVLALFSFNALCPLCTGLIIHEGSSVYRIFKRWQAVNQQWKVLNYEKAKDLADPINSHDGRNSHITDSRQRTSHHVRTILHQHCGYTILYILSQLRPNNLHRANQEVVMRVTTVWKWDIKTKKQKGHCVSFDFFF